MLFKTPNVGQSRIEIAGRQKTNEASAMITSA